MATANKYRPGPSTTRHNASVSNRSAKRFAQDDGLVGGRDIAGLARLKHEKSKKSQTASVPVVTRKAHWFKGLALRDLNRG